MADQDEQFFESLTDERLAEVKAKAEAEARKRKPIGTLSERAFEERKRELFKQK
jgi:hypothetical protein